MRNFIKSLFIIMGLLLVQGCATHENFVKKQNEWVGKNIAYLIGQNGYPDRTYTLPNKHKVYVYEHSQIISYPSFGFGYGGFYNDGFGMMGYGSNVEQRTCKLFIETNKKGIIVKWGSRGNACISK